MTNITDKLAKQYLAEYLKKTNPLFEKYLQEKIKQAQSMGKIPGELVKNYAAMARRGKKIRGALIVLGYQIGGGKDLESIYDTSLFIELFHTGILAHDDFMDQDNLRRGLPTLHKQFEKLGTKFKLSVLSTHYGESMAVNAGDFAFYLSWQKLLNGNFSPERLLRAGKIYADYIICLAEGQALDISNVNFENITEQGILKVIRYKTAEYTGVLPLLVGATLAGMDNERKIQALRNYGLALGWAFQIQDDILGTYGDEEKTGKPLGSDLREGKITLLTFHLMKQGTGKQRLYIKKLLNDKKVTEKDLLKTRKMLKEAGSYDYVVKLGWKYVEKGKQVIPVVTQNQRLKMILESLLIYMMERMV